MSGIRQAPDTSPGWVNRKFRELERQIRELRAARSLPGSSVDNGGTLTIGGALSVQTSDGTEMLRVGDMPIGRGVEMKRDDGSQAFRISKSFSDTEQQQWALLDDAGDIIAGENFGVPGLYRPHLEHPFQPVAATSGSPVTCGPYGWERSVASSTWTTLFAYDGKTQNAFLDLKLAVICSDGTTAGEMQVVDLNTGSALPGFLSGPWLGSIVAGTTALTIIDPTPVQVQLPIYSGTGTQMRIGLQAHRTAGTGTITVSIAQAIGG